MVNEAIWAERFSADQAKDNQTACYATIFKCMQMALLNFLLSPGIETYLGDFNLTQPRCQGVEAKLSGGKEAWHC